MSGTKQKDPTMVRTAFRTGVSAASLAAMSWPGHALAAAPSPISVGGIIADATPTVKLVIALLLIISVVSWAMLGAKTVQLRAAFSSIEQARDLLARSPSLSTIGDVGDGAVRWLLKDANRELDHSRGLKSIGSGGTTERVALTLARSEDHLARRIGAGVSFFATAGSVTPFVGLFGTVWGIMHSFMGIAQANSTSLAVVAPGIAEALLATAVGLVVAIPATVMYNVIGKWVGAYRSRLTDCSAAILCIVSRDIERGQQPHLAPVPSRAEA